MSLMHNLMEALNLLQNKIEHTAIKIYSNVQSVYSAVVNVMKFVSTKSYFPHISRRNIYYSESNSRLMWAGQNINIALSQTIFDVVAFKYVGYCRLNFVSQNFKVRFGINRLVL